MSDHAIRMMRRMLRDLAIRATFNQQEWLKWGGWR